MLTSIILLDRNFTANDVDIMAFEPCFHPAAIRTMVIFSVDQNCSSLIFHLFSKVWFKSVLFNRNLQLMSVKTSMEIETQSDKPFVYSLFSLWFCQDQHTRILLLPPRNEVSLRLQFPLGILRAKRKLWRVFEKIIKKRGARKKNLP